MTIFTSILPIGSMLHYSVSSLLRYWYVKTSLQPDIQKGLIGKYYYHWLLAPQILLIMHLFDGFINYKVKGTEGFPLLLHQACKDPFSEYRIPFYKLMPFQQIMIYVYIYIIIHSNLFLYKFLMNQADKRNLAMINKVDRKRDRKRNFVPAQTGILMIFIVMVSVIFYAVTYSITSVLIHIKLDAGTRAYLLALYNDLYPCLLSPLIVLFGAPTVRRQLNIQT